MHCARALLLVCTIATPSFLALGCGDDDGTSMSNNNADGSVRSDAGTVTGSIDAATGSKLDASSSVLDAALSGNGDAATDGGAPAADYAKAENWLCRPDRPTDACHVNLDTTIVKADGTLEVEKFTAAANPPVDCFYVYPTVSLDSTPNSDLVPGEEENAGDHRQ